MQHPIGPEGHPSARFGRDAHRQTSLLLCRVDLANLALQHQPASQLRPPIVQINQQRELSVEGLLINTSIQVHVELGAVAGAQVQLVADEPRGEVQLRKILGHKFREQFRRGDGVVHQPFGGVVLATIDLRGINILLVEVRAAYDLLGDIELVGVPKGLDFATQEAQHFVWQHRVVRGPPPLVPKPSDQISAMSFDGLQDQSLHLLRVGYPRRILRSSQLRKVAHALRLVQWHRFDGVARVNVACIVGLQGDTDSADPGAAAAAHRRGEARAAAAAAAT
mmetsp:Transcript_151524/g.486253  ORF Transcript_151524/g.486253 Transcript_151524/m.486253 type:complete len:279 (+) Transcript_151524:332-1168(+)